MVIEHLELLVDAFVNLHDAVLRNCILIALLGYLILIVHVIIVDYLEILDGSAARSGTHMDLNRGHQLRIEIVNLPVRFCFFELIHGLKEHILDF